MGNQGTETYKALSIGSETQLFVDDAIVSAKRGVVRTLHPGKKLEQPVLFRIDRGKGNGSTSTARCITTQTRSSSVCGILRVWAAGSSTGRRVCVNGRGT